MNITPDEFLEICNDFKLGNLPTECPRKETIGLSELVNNDLRKSVNVLKEIDVKVFEILLEKIERIRELNLSVYLTLKEGGRIFLCGCGATGRLSLTLENIWRNNLSKIKKKELKAQLKSDFVGKQGIKYEDSCIIDSPEEKVISFMAGGDIALIKSIEDFEDHPEFGERQLIELGFSEKDLLISSTEGGETSWVIGTSNYAAKEYKAGRVKRKPYFLYCNPDESLQNIKRSKEVLENEFINKVNLFCGEMAITGSTRMQASTILQYFIGLAFNFDYEFSEEKKTLEANLLEDITYSERIKNKLHNFIKTLNSNDLEENLSILIKLESELYFKSKKKALKKKKKRNRRKP